MIALLFLGNIPIALARLPLGGKPDKAYGQGRIGIVEIELETAAPERGLQLPLALGFSPLDDLLNGGLRPGELMIIGGAAGVGKSRLAR